MAKWQEIAGPEKSKIFSIWHFLKKTLSTSGQNYKERKENYYHRRQDSGCHRERSGLGPGGVWRVGVHRLAGFLGGSDKDIHVIVNWTRLTYPPTPHLMISPLVQPLGHISSVSPTHFIHTATISIWTTITSCLDYTEVPKLSVHRLICRICEFVKTDFWVPSQSFWLNRSRVGPMNL